MPYRMTIRSNPKLLIVPLVVLGLLALAVSLFTAGPIPGLLGLAGGGYLAYTLIRFVRKQLQCSVDLVDDGLQLSLYGEEKVTARWTEISHLGSAVDTKGRRSLFVYREGEDKLLVIPDEFERFADLVTALRDACRAVAPDRPFHELSLGLGETVKDRLRTIVGRPRVNDGDTEEDADTPAGTSPRL